MGISSSVDGGADAGKYNWQASQSMYHLPNTKDATANTDANTIMDVDMSDVVNAPSVPTPAPPPVYHPEPASTNSEPFVASYNKKQPNSSPYSFNVGLNQEPSHSRPDPPPYEGVPLNQQLTANLAGNGLAAPITGKRLNIWFGQRVNYDYTEYNTRNPELYQRIRPENIEKYSKQFYIITKVEHPDTDARKKVREAIEEIRPQNRWNGFFIMCLEKAYILERFQLFVNLVVSTERGKDNTDEGFILNKANALMRDNPRALVDYRWDLSDEEHELIVVNSMRMASFHANAFCEEDVQKEHGWYNRMVDAENLGRIFFEIRKITSDLLNGVIYSENPNLVGVVSTLKDSEQMFRDYIFAVIFRIAIIKDKNSKAMLVTESGTLQPPHLVAAFIHAKIENFVLPTLNWNNILSFYEKHQAGNLTISDYESCANDPSFQTPYIAFAHLMFFEEESEGLSGDSMFLFTNIKSNSKSHFFTEDDKKLYDHALYASSMVFLTSDLITLNKPDTDISEFHRKSHKHYDHLVNICRAYVMEAIDRVDRAEVNRGLEISLYAGKLDTMDDTGIDIETVLVNSNEILRTYCQTIRMVVIFPRVYGVNLVYTADEYTEFECDMLFIPRRSVLYGDFNNNHDGISGKVTYNGPLKVDITRPYRDKADDKYALIMISSELLNLLGTECVGSYLMTRSDIKNLLSISTREKAPSVVVPIFENIILYGRANALMKHVERYYRDNQSVVSTKEAIVLMDTYISKNHNVAHHPKYLLQGLIVNEWINQKIPFQSQVKGHVDAFDLVYEVVLGEIKEFIKKDLGDTQDFLIPANGGSSNVLAVVKKSIESKLVTIKEKMMEIVVREETEEEKTQKVLIKIEEEKQRKDNELIMKRIQQEVEQDKKRKKEEEEKRQRELVAPGILAKKYVPKKNSFEDEDEDEEKIEQNNKKSPFWFGERVDYVFNHDLRDFYRFNNAKTVDDEFLSVKPEVKAWFDESDAKTGFKDLEDYVMKNERDLITRPDVYWNYRYIFRFRVHFRNSFHAYQKELKSRNGEPYDLNIFYRKMFGRNSNPGTWTNSIYRAHLRWIVVHTDMELESDKELVNDNGFQMVMGLLTNMGRIYMEVTSHISKYISEHQSDDYKKYYPNMRYAEKRFVEDFLFSKLMVENEGLSKKWRIALESVNPKNMEFIHQTNLVRLGVDMDTALNSIFSDKKSVYESIITEYDARKKAILEFDDFSVSDPEVSMCIPVVTRLLSQKEKDRYGTSKMDIDTYEGSIFFILEKWGPDKPSDFLKIFMDMARACIPMMILFDVTAYLRADDHHQHLSVLESMQDSFFFFEIYMCDMAYRMAKKEKKVDKATDLWDYGFSAHLTFITGGNFYTSSNGYMGSCVNFVKVSEDPADKSMVFESRMDADDDQLLKDDKKPLFFGFLENPDRKMDPHPPKVKSGKLQASDRKKKGHETFLKSFFALSQNTKQDLENVPTKDYSWIIGDHGVMKDLTPNCLGNYCLARRNFTLEKENLIKNLTLFDTMNKALAISRHYTEIENDDHQRYNNKARSFLVIMPRKYDDNTNCFDTLNDVRYLLTHFLYYCYYYPHHIPIPDNDDKKIQLTEIIIKIDNEKAPASLLDIFLIDEQANSNKGSSPDPDFVKNGNIRYVYALQIYKKLRKEEDLSKKISASAYRHYRLKSENDSLISGLLKGLLRNKE